MMTRDEIREVINSLNAAVDEVAAAVGSDLSRDDEGFIIDGSDLGIAVRELERVSTVLTRLFFRLGEE
jgi:hypothetical protein